jgi:indolepyruvate ferredoxin oxidoreductase alpha subunit
LRKGQPEFIEQNLSTFLYQGKKFIKFIWKRYFSHGWGVHRPDNAGKFNEFHQINNARYSTLVKSAHQILHLPKYQIYHKQCQYVLQAFVLAVQQRPIFAAMKLVEKDLGKHQITGDIGCHLFATLPSV